MSDEPSYQISLEVNGQSVEATVPARMLLVEFIRERLELTGTHIGCDTSQCGACTIHLDGLAIKSCTILAVQASGRQVTTIEGFEPSLENALQKAFKECHALQCGYCTPGMIMACSAFLAENPSPTEAEIAEALDGNLCRCTGYRPIMEAVKRAANDRQGVE